MVCDLEALHGDRVLIIPPNNEHSSNEHSDRRTSQRSDGDGAHSTPHWGGQWKNSRLADHHPSRPAPPTHMPRALRCGSCAVLCCAVLCERLTVSC